MARSYNSNIPKELKDRCCFVDLANDKVVCGSEMRFEEEVVAV